MLLSQPRHGVSNRGKGLDHAVRSHAATLSQYPDITLKIYIHNTGSKMYSLGNTLLTHHYGIPLILL